MTLYLRKLTVFLAGTLWLGVGATQPESTVRLAHGTDESAGGGPAYIVSTPAATYYLEKEGGGLSSMVDPDGIDWLGFHSEAGSGWKGEYRGFPNAVHRQDGNYFHAMNAGTDPSSSVVDIESGEHVRITFTSGNGHRPYMTVLGFGRRDKDKFLDTAQTFSIGFIESTEYAFVDRSIRQVLD